MTKRIPTGKCHFCKPAVQDSWRWYLQFLGDGISSAVFFDRARKVHRAVPLVGFWVLAQHLVSTPQERGIALPQKCVLGVFREFPVRKVATSERNLDKYQPDIGGSTVKNSVCGGDTNQKASARDCNVKHSLTECFRMFPQAERPTTWATTRMETVQSKPVRVEPATMRACDCGFSDLSRMLCSRHCERGGTLVSVGLYLKTAKRHRRGV